MLYPNVETFIGCDSSYRAASIVLYGAPYDSTTSYRPGARFGPAAIRHESYGLETYSPYQNADLTDFDIFDSGDLELCFGSSESALADIQSRAAEILHDGKFPLLLGGEHLVTLGAVRAMVEKYPDLHIVHFDAHADLRDDYLGAKLSHACVLRRCHDLIGDGRIHQFCIRSGDRTEFEFAAAHTADGGALLRHPAVCGLCCPADWHHAQPFYGQGWFSDRHVCGAGAGIRAVSGAAGQCPALAEHGHRRGRALSALHEKRLWRH